VYVGLAVVVLGAVGVVAVVVAVIVRDVLGDGGGVWCVQPARTRMLAAHAITRFMRYHLSGIRSTPRRA
jgi:hypothetical protein